MMAEYDHWWVMVWKGENKGAHVNSESNKGEYLTIATEEKYISYLLRNVGFISFFMIELTFLKGAARPSCRQAIPWNSRIQPRISRELFQVHIQIVLYFFFY